jgi:dephospho-CoA kinase
MLKIIAFTGMPFSGKTEAVQVAKKQDIPVVRMGEMVWNEAKKQGLELNDENVGNIANQMRNKHGKDIWAKRALEKIKKMGDTDILVIDGVRNVEEIETFKQELGEDFVVVAIDVSDQVRYERAMSRDRKDDSKDLEKIKERDRRELGWGLGDVIASADIVVSNDKSIEAFFEEIRKILCDI